MVNSWEKGGGTEENKAKARTYLKEVAPLVVSMEAGADDGDGEGGEHGRQEVLLRWGGGQAAGQVFTTIPKPYYGAMKDLVKDNILHNIKVEEERENGGRHLFAEDNTSKANAALWLIKQLIELEGKFIQHIGRTLEG